MLHRESGVHYIQARPHINDYFLSFKRQHSHIPNPNPNPSQPNSSLPTPPLLSPSSNMFRQPLILRRIRSHRLLLLPRPTLSNHLPTGTPRRPSPSHPRTLHHPTHHRRILRRSSTRTGRCSSAPTRRGFARCPRVHERFLVFPYLRRRLQRCGSC